MSKQEGINTISKAMAVTYLLIPANGDAEAFQPAVGDEVTLPQLEQLSRLCQS